MVWLTFALAICFCVAVLYVPGYLVGRAVSLERFASVAVAPAFSVVALVILGVIPQCCAREVRWLDVAACVCGFVPADLWCVPRASRFEGC